MSAALFQLMNTRRWADESQVIDYNDFDRSDPLTQGGVFIALVRLMNTRRWADES